MFSRDWYDGDLPLGWHTGFVPGILSFFGMISLLLALGGFAAGWGLLERRSWGRTLAIALAIISLFNPVLGTLLGIYTLWVLLPGESEAEWRRTATI